jgi:hypothetical protein
LELPKINHFEEEHHAWIDNERYGISIKAMLEYPRVSQYRWPDFIICSKTE